MSKIIGRRKDTGEDSAEIPTAAVIVHGPQRCGKTTNARRLAQMLHCDVIQDEQNLDVINHRFPPHRTLFLVNAGVEQLVERLKRNAVSRGQNPETLRIELYEYDDLMNKPCYAKGGFVTGQSPVIGESCHERLWPTPVHGFQHTPVNFSIPHKKADVRGVAHGATMYAMGLVEGMMVGDRYITLIVNGDDDVKNIFIDYPFINWDSGRVQVRTVSEVLMVNAEEQAALGYAEWVADVTPDNLNALLELDRWQHFVAVLSGDKFDRFAKDYSQ